jgi:exodeoxyribonuclease III
MPGSHLLSARFAARNEDRSLQHQQHQAPPANLLDWMRAAESDVVCLQELKATDAEFPADAIRTAGYEAVWRGQKTWNGVAILSRWKPIQTRNELPGDPSDAQSRYIEAAVNGIIVASSHAPNGNPQPGPKFDYKLAWLKRLAVHAAELLTAGVPVVLAGDYNVVPADRDIYPSKSWIKDALLQPESRAAYADLLKQGWLDAVWAVHPNEPMYTYWDYLRNRRQRNAGLRIDHILLSPSVASRLQASGLDREVRGQENASVHAPVWVELADKPQGKGSADVTRRGVSPRRIARLKPVSVGSQTRLCQRREFLPGKGLAGPETGPAFSATAADSAKQRPGCLASMAANPREVKDYSDGARKPSLRRTAWWGW